MFNPLNIILLYCGEAFCNVDDNGAAALDIKLLSNSIGKGIGHKALVFAIDSAFNDGKAKLVLGKCICTLQNYCASQICVNRLV